MSHATAAASPLVLERMTPFQWTAIAICVLLNMLDGFDVMVMAFTAPHVSADWALSGKLLGIMLSAGLVGMALGSFLLAPLADRWGRRPMIMLCLVILTVGSQRIGFVVDQLVGQEEVVIKPLDALLQGTPGMAGATITSDGGIALILDVPNLLKHYAKRSKIKFDRFDKFSA